ncbi:MAG: molybdopterin cofactor-binding domain-containing protein, partial [Halobacteriales archaeon]
MILQAEANRPDLASNLEPMPFPLPEGGEQGKWWAYTEGFYLHESAPNNVAFEWTAGDPEETEAAFEAAEHVVELELDHQRLAPTPIEPRAAVADYQPGAGELHVRISSPPIKWPCFFGIDFATRAELIANGLSV